MDSTALEKSTKFEFLLAKSNPSYHCVGVQSPSTSHSQVAKIVTNYFKTQINHLKLELTTEKCPMKPGLGHFLYILNLMVCDSVQNSIYLFLSSNVANECNKTFITNLVIDIFPTRCN